MALPHLLEEILNRLDALAHHVELPSSVAQSVAGRVLVGLLDLPEHGFRRADVARWMRSGPIRWRGRPLPVGWDTTARRAGVVQGLEQWASRLDHRCAVSEDARKLAAEALGGEYTMVFNGVEVEHYDRDDAHARKPADTSSVAGGPGVMAVIPSGAGTSWYTKGVRSA